MSYNHGNNKNNYNSYNNHNSYSNHNKHYNNNGEQNHYSQSQDNDNRPPRKEHYKSKEHMDYDQQRNNHHEQMRTSNRTIDNTREHNRDNTMENTREGITIAGNILAKISFCDKQCSNVNDNKVKAAVVKHLELQHNIQIIARDFTIINPTNFRIVSYHQHVLTPLTNGNPYLLYLTRIDGINCCLYIDRKLKDGYTFPKMHCVKYNFHNELFEKDTVFAGELVKDTERRWCFLIDNIIIYKGMSTVEKNVIARYELIHNILANEYTFDRFLEICPLQVKRLFLYRDVKKMVEDFIPNLSYTCKGILFYTLNNRCTNFAFLLPRDSQFEIKSPNEIDEIVQAKYPKLWAKKHTINQEHIADGLSIVESNTANKPLGEFNEDNTRPIAVDNVVFKILKTDIPDIYNLYCIDSNNGLIKYGIALVPNIRISHYLYNTFKSDHNNLNLRVECRFSKIFEKWSPIRFVVHNPFCKSDIEIIEEKMKN
jgi:hypothetical protein